MKIWALTGGIATGKSTVSRLLVELLPSATIFDADASVRNLIVQPEIQLEIERALNRSFRDVDGLFDKEALRELVFADASARKSLEGVFHPLVRQELLAQRDLVAKTDGSALFVADVPLLFENGFDFGQDKTLVVATSRSTQRHRLKERNGFEDTLIENILSAQWPIERKIECADIVLWNEGPREMLRAQLHKLLVHHQLIMTEEIAEEEPVTIEPTKPKVVIPEVININEFRQRPLADLQAMGEAIPQRLHANLTKSQLVFELLSFYAREGTVIEGIGVIEQAKENYAMLRDPARSFKTSPDDLYINAHLLREHDLRVGQLIKVRLRQPRGRDKYLSATEVVEIEGIPAAEATSSPHYDKLTPLFPDERLILENPDTGDLSVRVIDLMAPLGKGQRGLIVAPPRGGKTIMLKQIARSIRRNHPEVHLIVLLLDERPEEVTDFEELVDADIFSSTFDEPAKRHAQVSDLVLERAKRRVEQGKDVVLLLDSLTRLARGHNNATFGGPIGSGGVNPVALQKVRKFFGAARNVENGGSLTILASALIETENRMDEVIFEEFKGTGNMEIHLDRELAERRVFPAIHIPKSGTRNDDRLYHEQELARVLDIRKQLSKLPVGDAIELLLKNLVRTKSNAELLLTGIR